MGLVETNKFMWWSCVLIKRIHVNSTPIRVMVGWYLRFLLINIDTSCSGTTLEILSPLVRDFQFNPLEIEKKYVRERRSKKWAIQCMNPNLVRLRVKIKNYILIEQVNMNSRLWLRHSTWFALSACVYCFVLKMCLRDIV